MTIITFERFTRVTPLGVRFWDVASHVPVDSGLSVALRLSHNRLLSLSANTKGVYYAQNVPGLRLFEAGDGSDEFWDNTPAPQIYTLEVRDPQRRYHPFIIQVRVPSRRIFEWNCPTGLLNAPAGYIPVYSTAGRSLNNGMAVLRTDLYDPAAKRPASWALLEVLLDGERLGVGIADQQGRVMVAFAYPSPIDTAPDSPSFGIPLTQQSWNLSLRGYYGASAAAVPDLCEVLSQPAVDLWRHWTSDTDRQTFTTVALPYGREAFATSVDGAGQPLSRLYVTP